MEIDRGNFSCYDNENRIFYEINGRDSDMNRLSGAFDNILRELRQGSTAELELEVEGAHYLRTFRPRERLILLGGGHVSCHLCSFAHALGFSVWVVDDRPSFANKVRFPEADGILCDDFIPAIQRLNISPSDYVAVMTRGHRYDADCLRTVLSGVLPRYMGMIASRRRSILLMNQLAEEGFDRSVLDTIHSPIGLDIGALTLPEIAVSVSAELVQCRRAKTNRRSHSQRLTLEEIDLPLLEFIVEEPSPKALLLVLDTSGSTPVKSGAMMAVDENYRSMGTIGGGCSENLALRKAWQLIGSGKQTCMTVDMSDDDAEKEGMVCGGQMLVLLADLTCADKD
jgi:xanthine dehydrogenase accessory factor